MSAANQVILDVRPQLREKNDPFRIIMDTVNQLQNGQELVLHATLKPLPLLGVMKLKGYSNHVEKLANDHWVVTFTPKTKAADDADPAAATTEESNELPPVAEGRHFTLDNRGLQPPQPMMRTLDKLEHMQPGDTLVITNDRVPVFLLEELKGLGYQYEVEQMADETAQVTIRK